jgi:GNAT superfamily N-acetyltransferase
LAKPVGCASASVNDGLAPCQPVYRFDARHTLMPIRLALPEDAVVLESMIRDYLHESYSGHLGTPAATLRLDVLAGATTQRVLLAERLDGLTGFVAWDGVYDLHWAARGAQIADLYVVPAARGLGIALELLASLCSVLASEGGVFVRGGAYDRASTRAFYGRIAVVEPGTGETHLSGRAFRQLAALGGLSARAIARALPALEWNQSN